MNTSDLITLAAGTIAFLSVYIAWNALAPRRTVGDRAKSLASRRRTLKAQLLAPRPSPHRRVAAMGLMRRLIHRLNLLRGEQAARITAQLTRAGWRSKDALVTYLFFKVCLPFAFGVAAVLAVYVFQVFELTEMFRLLAAMVCVVAGAYAPEIVVNQAMRKRRERIQRGLPDALDLMVICAEAGLAFDAALSRGAGEMERSCPEIADEFGLAAVELGFLPERGKALENLCQRTSMDSIRGVVNTLRQTEKYGTPLAQSLRVLSDEFRNERMMKAEEKAAKLPAVLTLPLIVFILPTLFIVLLGPAILGTIDGLGGLDFDSLGGM